MVALLFFIIGFPLLEIFVMIEVGSIIGALNTIFLILFTAVTGIYYARLQGISTLKSGISQLIKNEIPLFEIISGAALAFASFLLILPGFISDFIGFMLIIPFTRKIIFKIVASKFPKPKQEQKNKNYIDGEFEEIKDD
jgi:UPF0716 protein FxsA